LPNSFRKPEQGAGLNVRAPKLTGRHSHLSPNTAEFPLKAWLLAPLTGKQNPHRDVGTAQLIEGEKNNETSR